MRDLLLDREKHTGIVDYRIDEAVIPECCRYLWESFLILHSRRMPVANVMAPISVEAINAYAQSVGVSWSPWEVETLLELDTRVIAKLSAQKV